MTDDDEKRRRSRRRRAERDERLASARRVLRFALTEPLHRDMRRRLLNEAIWVATESEFHKHKLSLRTVEADREILKSEPKLGSRVRHEHVYQRRWIIDQMLTDPARAEEILETYAVACVVTVAEAKRLDEHDHLTGWERYSQAKVDVIEVLPDGSIRSYKPPA